MIYSKKHSLPYLQAWIEKYEEHITHVEQSTEEGKLNNDDVENK